MTDERIAELENIKLESIEQAHELINECGQSMAEIMQKMRETTGEEYKSLQNRHYRIRGARNRIRHAMLKLVNIKG